MKLEICHDEIKTVLEDHIKKKFNVSGGQLDIMARNSEGEYGCLVFNLTLVGVYEEDF